MNNPVMLITYPDSLGRNLRETFDILDRHYKDAVSMVHLLPFFPSSGDRGFAPIRYDQVDGSFGSFEDLNQAAQKYTLMYDFMVNHISAQSPQFQDYLRHHEKSPYRDFFLPYLSVFGGREPAPQEVERIYKRKPRPPYIDVKFADGRTQKLWCTFSEEQVDLNCQAPAVLEFFRDTIRFLCRNGASWIRLDALGYAIKKAGTSCFFIEPEIWELMDKLSRFATEAGARILPEVHEHYRIQRNLSSHGYWVYDFTLPMLLLHAIYSGRCESLVSWLNMCPERQMTTLDTHDGIGVVDAADLLTEEEIGFTTDCIYRQGANVKRKYSMAAYKNLDIYQINCTYYSALGNRDDAYLLARCVQFFAPGIPQVYYVGMLAGKNDIALVERTMEGRNINRHYYTPEEVAETLQTSAAAARLRRLMRFRNGHKSFDGSFTCAQTGEHTFRIQRENGAHRSMLEADLQTMGFTIHASDPAGKMMRVEV